jgi:sulfur-oxidizing protein SoxX
VLCHTIPGFKDGGEMGPNLAGLSQRMTPEQIRMRIADPRVLNPQTFMPAYFSTEGLHNVAKPLVGKTVLSEQSLEDIVAYLLEVTKGP